MQDCSTIKSNYLPKCTMLSPKSYIPNVSLAINQRNAI